jgi:carotenoid cleavage dioxygenase
VDYDRVASTLILDFADGVAMSRLGGQLALRTGVGCNGQRDSQRAASHMTDNPYLAGNFGPVDDEFTATDLPVTGEIPMELSGRLLRIGPNPVNADPETYHWFLGNGMVHGLRLRDGKAEWYRARYVRDDELTAHFGWPAVEGPQAALAIGNGIANTNIIGHAGKTLAIVEAGNLPVELDYELETVGRMNFNGGLTGGFSAHPHLDPDTGDLHTAVYSPMWQHIQYVRVDASGHVSKTVDVPTPGRPMVHDCMFTENYFILLDLPVTLNEGAMVEGLPFPYLWDPEYGARVGLLPRDGDADDVTWHEVELCYVFHPMNAFEDERGRVVMDVVRHPRMFASDRHGPNEGRTRLDRWVIDPASARVSECCLDEHPQEFPRLDERRAGKPYRFGYTTEIGQGLVGQGLRKHDLREGRVTVHDPGPNRHFMEPVFVPRQDAAEEDDGWVMAYVHDAEQGAGEVVILNARDFDGEPVATISLPRRVPYGFHGNWVPD